MYSIKIVLCNVQGPRTNIMDDALLFRNSDEAIEYQSSSTMNVIESEERIRNSILTERKVDLMHYFDEQGLPHREEIPDDLYLPLWQTSPYLQSGVVNDNIFRRPNVSDIALTVIENETAVLGEFNLAPPGKIADPNRRTSRLATLLSVDEEKEVEYLGDPVSNLFMPVYSSFNQAIRTVSGVLVSTISWRSHFRKYTDAAQQAKSTFFCPLFYTSSHKPKTLLDTTR